jgi:hypothetical protein
VKKFLTLFFCSALVLALLAGCNATDNDATQNNDNQQLGEADNNGSASGTQLAGQESPLVSGTFEGAAGDGTVTVLVDGEAKTYQLSEDAQKQVDNGSVSKGDQVKFQTFSIGSATLTIDSFLDVE